MATTSQPGNWQEKDMAALRFDGMVAIVTGGGGQKPSLGRSHALFLASRGAKVVVNDIGVGPDGRNEVPASAAALVDEIRAAGGDAVADTNSVATPDSAKAVVQTALETFGAIHIVINNAGVALLAPFEELSDCDISRMLDVHMLGPIWMCRAAWPHMKQQRYGRIVNVGSTAMFGIHGTSVYGAAKGGTYSLTRALAVEGEDYDIKVNTILPMAGTVAISHLQSDSELTRAQLQQSPELVSPVVGLLAHQSCPCSGKAIEAGGGKAYDVVLGTTTGYQSSAISIENLADNWDQVVDQAGLKIAPDTLRDLRMSLKAYKPA